MRDEDRADKLARAIEEMVQGGLPEDLGDEELKELNKKISLVLALHKSWIN